MSFDTGLAVGLAIGKKKFSGGTNDDNWVYPTDWLVCPEPSAYQITLVVTSTIYNVLYPSTQYLDGDKIVDWGDGNVVTYPEWTPIPAHTYTAGTGTIIDNGSEQWCVTITLNSASGYVKFYNRRTTQSMILAAKVGESVLLKGGDTSSFYAQYLLSYIKIVNPNISIASETYMFFNCISLRVVEWGTPITDIPLQTFYGCVTLQKIDLLEVISIGNGAFFNCPAIKKYDLPKCTSIGSTSIVSNHALKEIIAPLLLSVGDNGITSNYTLTIFTYAVGCTFGTGNFTGCYMLYPIPT